VQQEAPASASERSEVLNVLQALRPCSGVLGSGFCARAAAPTRQLPNPMPICGPECPNLAQRGVLGVATVTGVPFGQFCQCGICSVEPLHLSKWNMLPALTPAAAAAQWRIGACVQGQDWAGVGQACDDNLCAHQGLLHHSADLSQLSSRVKAYLCGSSQTYAGRVRLMQEARFPLPPPRQQLQARTA
jgi:hypothetical protein